MYSCNHITQWYLPNLIYGYFLFNTGVVLLQMTKMNKHTGSPLSSSMNWKKEILSVLHGKRKHGHVFYKKDVYLWRQSTLANYAAVFSVCNHIAAKCFSYWYWLWKICILVTLLLLWASSMLYVHMRLLIVFCCPYQLEVLQLLQDWQVWLLLH